MRLLEHLPLHPDASGLQLIHLRLGLCERQQRIGGAVGDKERLLGRDWRLLGDELARVVRVAADADQAGQVVRIAQANFERHQAALRKTE